MFGMDFQSAMETFAEAWVTANAANVAAQVSDNVISIKLILITIDG
jgi:hypothetical protein